MRALLILVSACTLVIGLWSGSAIPIKPATPHQPLVLAKSRLAEEDSDKHAETIALLEEGISRTKRRRDDLEKALSLVYSFSCIVGGAGLVCAIGAPSRGKTPDPAQDCMAIV